MKTLLKNMAFLFSLSFCITFTGCTNDLKNNTLETLLVQLPKWPPEDELKNEYPELVKWVIRASSCDDSKEFIISKNDESFLLEVQRNLPITITATPVTVLKNNKHCSYFYPAGNIYPYFWEPMETNIKSGTLQLTWECGFTATMMERIFKTPEQTGVTKDHLLQFMQGFNWKKFQETIEKKITESMDSTKFYNPWLIDSEELLENLTFAIFNTNFLNNSYVYSIPLSLLEIPEKDSILSPFIPENSYLEKNKAVSLKKDWQSLFMINNQYGILACCSSAKKVSHQFIYMPILIDDYED